MELVHSENIWNPSQTPFQAFSERDFFKQNTKKDFLNFALQTPFLASLGHLL